MTDKRYNIGIVVGNVEDDFSNAICKGAIQAAEELDDNLFIIPVKYIDYYVWEDPLQRYEYQYNALTAYAQVHSLDMVLICISTISVTTTRERCLSILKGFEGIPVILIASDEPGYSCVRYNNVSGLSEGISHLIEKEKRRHIGMITGYTDNSDSLERLNVYKQVLTEHGLPVQDSMMKFSMFNCQCEESVKSLLKDNPSLDAIVCGNDSMAVTAYQVLTERGIAVGTDISIIGFDNIEEAKHLTPPLATVQANASELGFRAVVQGHRKLQSNTALDPETFLVDTKFLYRDSIGTHSDNKILLQRQTDEQDKLFEKMRVADNHHKIIDMNHNMNILARDMLMLDDEGEQNYLHILNCLSRAGIKSCYLYMLGTPTPFYCKQDWKQPGKIYLRAYSENDKAIIPKKPDQRLSIQNIYSHAFLPDKRKTYIMLDLYSREMQYGFMLCDIDFSNFHYVEFLCYQISAAIKLTNMFEVNRSLLAEKDELVLRLQHENLQLDAISGKDELTGILNRRGFYKKAGDFIQQAKALAGQIIFAYADLNYLKQINDKYGHAEGDFALCACAKALEKVFPQGIVSRIGGDEFAILSACDASFSEEAVKAALNASLSQAAAASAKPYSITVSIGIWAPPQGVSFELEEAIERADALLYEEKKKKQPFTER